MLWQTKQSLELPQPGNGLGTAFGPCEFQWLGVDNCSMLFSAFSVFCQRHLFSSSTFWYSSESVAKDSQPHLLFGCCHSKICVHLHGHHAANCTSNLFQIIKCDPSPHGMMNHIKLRRANGLAESISLTFAFQCQNL